MYKKPKRHRLSRDELQRDRRPCTRCSRQRAVGKHAAFLSSHRRVHGGSVLGSRRPVLAGHVREGARASQRLPTPLASQTSASSARQEGSANLASVRQEGSANLGRGSPGHDQDISHYYQDVHCHNGSDLPKKNSGGTFYATPTQGRGHLSFKKQTQPKQTNANARDHGEWPTGQPRL